MKRWKILRRLSGLRAVLAIGAVIALPTLGTMLTCVAGMVPLVVANLLDAGGAGFGLAIALSGAAWITSAVGVVLGFGSILRRIGRLRANWGEAAIGSDGVRWSGMFGVKVVRWRDVESFSSEHGEDPSVMARLRNGRTVRWRVADAQRFVDAAREALERFRTAGAEPPPTELIPTEKGVAEWIGRVRTLLSEAGYRTNALTPEALVRVAEDPAAPSVARIGSVLALSVAEEPLKARVRVAIEETADPEVAELMTDALAGTVSARRVARVSERA